MMALILSHPFPLVWTKRTEIIKRFDRDTCVSPLRMRGKSAGARNVEQKSIKKHLVRNCESNAERKRIGAAIRGLCRGREHPDRKILTIEQNKNFVQYRGAVFPEKGENAAFCPMPAPQILFAMHPLKMHRYTPRDHSEIIQRKNTRRQAALRVSCVISFGLLRFP